MYSWTITRDRLGLGSAGICGPRQCKLSSKEIRNHPDAKKFRIKDDDGKVYCYGYLIGGDGFEPLDDYGTPALGATSIEYQNPETGAYETL